MTSHRSQQKHKHHAPAKQSHILSGKKGHFGKILYSFFWFVFGFGFAGIMLVSFTLFIFQINYKNKVYPGIFIENDYIGEKSLYDVEMYFVKKNSRIGKTPITYRYQEVFATTSAEKLNLGYNANLLAQQAYSLGRSKNIVSNLSIIINSYLNGTRLVSSYSFSESYNEQFLKPIANIIYREPVDALFTVKNNRVTSFRESEDGQILDYKSLTMLIENSIPLLLSSTNPKPLIFDVPIIVLKPTTTTKDANSFGIVEVIGEGKSTFAHSIPNRIYNISLAASRINGLLVAPNEEFSFNKALGDISKFTGYKEAYIIKDGRTVLGDGGGVCQVSTTLFRALLNSGLPITERHAHAYRVAYYEQDSSPGYDATVYAPSFDLKFKNDTSSHILIQAEPDTYNASLRFVLYGKKDNRIVEITKPIVKNQTPPPEPLYQDDATLPKGTEKQVDFAASGAWVSFERIVKKDDKTLIAEKFNSNYRPWQAVYLRGTKE